MVIRGEIENRGRFQQVVFSGGDAGEAVKTKELLRRAHQIHWNRGGLFGYDLEDWVEAEHGISAAIGQPRGEPEQVAD
ncbi:MAG: hypothetical protein ACREP9_04725 [Candidatus Dormibacteraceae bacterium]